MAQNTLEVRRDIERIRAELDETLDALNDHVRPSRIAERRTRKVRNTLTSARERVMGSASSATSSVGDGLQSAQGQLAEAGSGLAEQARQAPQMVVAETRGNPLVAGLVAFGIGLLAGSLAPATDMERQAVDAMSDQLEPVRQQATAVASSLKDEVTDAARESAQHLQEEMRDAARDVQSTAQSSVGAVQEQAQSSAQHVADAGRG